MILAGNRRVRASTGNPHGRRDESGHDMALPHASEARPFYQSAMQRFEDAQFLLAAGRTTGAVYLAGYSVECMLKALILSMASRKKRLQVLSLFRSSKAHDYDWLKRLYFKNGGAAFPSLISRGFAYVDPWSTDLRYKPGTIRQPDAEAFLTAVEQIIQWADGRT